MYFFSLDKKPTATDINIYTVKIREGKPMKVVKMTLAHIWKQGYKIRINNFGDKDSSAHSEKDIRSQVCQHDHILSFSIYHPRTDNTKTKVKIIFQVIVKHVYDSYDL